jgi:hypothetical protein
LDDWEAPVSLVGNTIGGTAGGVGVLIDAGNNAWSGPITLSSNTIGGTAGGDGILLDGGTGATGGFTGPIAIESNTVTLSGNATGGASLHLRKATESSSQPVVISENLLTGPQDTSSGNVTSGVVIDNSAGGQGNVSLLGNGFSGFGTGVALLGGPAGGGAVTAIIGGTPADMNTFTNNHFAVEIDGVGAVGFVACNGFTGNGTALQAQDGGTLNSMNNIIEVNSFQWGIGRGISASSGGKVMSKRDSIDMDPAEFAQAIFVDGGSFSGSNDLINGGSSSGNAVGLYVGPNQLPTESVSLNFSKIDFVHRAIQDDNTTPGVLVDASGNYWGANTEQGIANTIGGAGAADVDYSPWLDNGTNLATTGGFDGDFSQLDVGSGGVELQSGGRINEAVGLLTPGGTIQVYPGSYGEDVSLTKGLTLESVGGVTVTDINGDGLADAVASAPAVTGVVVGAPGRGFTINGGSNVAVGLNGTGEVLADNVLRTGGGSAAVVLAGTQEHLTGNVVVSSGSAWAVSITGGTEFLNDNVFQSTGPGNVTVADGTNAFGGNTFTAPPLAIESGFEQYRDTSAGLDSAGEITAVLDNDLFNRGVDRQVTSGATLNFSKIIWADIHPALAVASAGDTIGTLGGVYVEDVSFTQNLTLATSVAGSGETFIKGALTIQGGVTLRLQSPAATPLLTSSFTLAPTGMLDLANSTLLISYAGQSDPIAAIRAYIANGYNGGGWNGTPTAAGGVITSTSAQANRGYMIGYADSADGVVAGQPANTIELRYTLGGDLTLSGTVNFDDFSKVVADYGKPAFWDGGAITYGSTVSFSDFALTVANYGRQAITSASLAAVNASAAPLHSTTTNGSSSLQSLPPNQSIEFDDAVTLHLRPSKLPVKKRR